MEGAITSLTVNGYERNPAARQECLAYYGFACSVCTFSFEYYDGELGHRYIQVHHLKPLNEIGEEYAVDPVRDLVPVCPNCHAMIHRKSPALSIEELKAMLRKTS